MDLFLDCLEENHEIQRCHADKIAIIRILDRYLPPPSLRQNVGVFFNRSWSWSAAFQGKELHIAKPFGCTWRYDRRSCYIRGKERQIVTLRTERCREKRKKSTAKERHKINTIPFLLLLHTNHFLRRGAFQLETPSNPSNDAMPSWIIPIY